MKRNRSYVLWIVTMLLLSSFMGIGLNASAQPENVYVDGYVLENGSGLPIENATVILQNTWDGSINTTKTNATGYYNVSIYTPPGGENFILTAFHEDYLMNSQFFWLNPGSPQYWELYLDLAITKNSNVHGKIFDAYTMTPLPFAGVAAMGENYINTTSSNATGYFWMALESDQTYYIQAERSGYLSQMKSGWIGSGDNRSFNFLLEPLNCTLRGYLKDQGGPVGFASVHVYKLNEEVPTEYWPEVNFTTGYFELTLTRGIWQVEVEDGVHYSQTLSVIMVNDETTWQNFTMLKLPVERATVQGYVTYYHNGSGVPWASVNAQNLNATWNTFNNSNGTGWYTLSVLPGEVRFDAWSNQYGALQTIIDTQAAGVYDLNLTMYDWWSESWVEGYVRVNGTGEPDAMITVFLGNWQISERTDALGHYNVSIPAAPVEIHANQNGFKNSAAWVNTTDGETTFLDFDLTALDWSCELNGYINNTNGEPLEGAYASFDYDGYGWGSATASTDYTGFYQAMAPAGDASYFILAEGHEYKVGNADLPASQIFWYNETLTPVDENARVICRFTNIYTGKPIKNVGITFSELDLQYFSNSVTNKNGMVKADVPSGFIGIGFNAWENGYQNPGMFRERSTMRFYLQPSEIRWLNISLFPRQAHSILHGYVNDTGSNPIPGATVYVQYGDTIITNTTDSLGYYELRLPGDHEIRSWVRVPGYKISEYYDWIGDWEDRWYDWILEDSPAWIEGPITDSVADLDGDSEYDVLYVNVTVNVAQVGDYILDAYLAESRDESGIAGADTEFGSTLGLQVVTLAFMGEQIRNSKKDGYFVDIELYNDVTWERLDESDYFTTPYRHDEFDIPDARIETPIEPWLVDSDLDGLYNYLIFNVTLNVSVAGDYTVMAPFMDIWGNEFDMAFETYSLEVGLQQVQVTLDGSAIYNNGQRLGSVYMIVFEGFPTGGMDYIHSLYFYAPYDHDIFQFYEIDSFVSGYVTDIWDQPIEGIDIWLYNITEKFLNNTRTNASGYFELGGWSGDWVLVVNDEDNENTYQGDLAEIILSTGMTTHDFLNLPYTELDQIETQLIFSDWNNTHLDWLLYAIGDNRTIRFDLDVRQFGDGDGFLSEEEVEVVMGMIGTLDLPANSNESFLVDGIWYDLNQSSLTRDAGLVGSITSTDPVYIHLTGDYTANSTIPDPSPHDLTLNSSYDDTDSGSFIGNNVTHIVYIAPPLDWGRTGNGVPQNVTISGSGYITVDHLNDPNPGDTETWEWVNMTISSGETSTIGTIKGNVTLQGGSGHNGVEVTVYINGTLTEVDRGHTDPSGHFEIPGLPAGNYDVVAHKAGYEDNWSYNVTLNAGETLWIDFILYSFPPTISHTPVTSAVLGDPIEIVADVSDDGSVDEVVLYYKDVGSGSYSSTTMSRIPSTSTYMGTIPAQIALGYVDYYIWANDTKGNWAVHPSVGNHSIWIYEATPPDIALVLVIPDSAEYPEFVNISAQITDMSVIVTVSLYVEFPDMSNSNLTMNYDSFSGRYYLNASFSMLGKYNYTIWANDSYDNWNLYSGSFDVLDTILPTSNVITIAPYWFGSSPITISAIASDSGIGVESVELWYRYSSDNSTWGNWTMFSVDLGSPWSWSFNFPDGDGYYEFFSIANDSAGNPETIKSVAETICAYDTTGPTSSMNIIVSYWQSTSPLIVTASASDDLIGTQNVELWYRNSTDNSTWSSWMQFGIDSAVPWSWNFNFPDGDGYYEFYSIANDSLGNPESPKTIAETICAYDTTGPTSGLDVIATYWHSSSPLLITASASDDLMGVQNVELWFRNSTDNSTWSAWTQFGIDSSAPWSWNFNFPDGDGYYEFYSIANDGTGNPESPKSVAESICAYDTMGPASNVNVIASYWQSTSPLLITAMASDDLIGVQNVELWFRNSTDNSSWGTWTLFGVDSGSPWSWDFNFPAGDGYYEFFSIANDSLGNIETMKVSAELICGFDSSLPISSVNAIAPYWSSGSAITITATASDQIIGVDTVTLWYRYSEDNSSWGSWSSYGTDSASPWSFSFNYPDGDGYYQFYSIARDILGHNEGSKTSYEARFARDTQIPTIDSISATPDPSELGEDITITVSPSDIAGIAGAWVEITNDTGPVGNFSMTQSGSDYVYVYSSQGIGTESYVIWVSDNNGNWNSITDSVEVEDTSAPTVEDFTTFPSDPDVGDSVRISVNVSDASYLKVVNISISDPSGGFLVNESMTYDSQTGTYYYDYTYTEIGTYQIEIWVEDLIGNIFIYSDTVISSDSEPPVAHAGVEQQITIGTQVSLEGTGSSDNHEIANYTWEFNDNGLKRLYGETPQYTFNSPGAYLITLRVRDFGGNTDEAKTWVNVSAVTSEGTITGTVLDNDGNPIEDATVYLEGDPLNEDVTDDLGRYTLENVPIGNQTLVVVKDGYKRDSISVDVQGDQPTLANIALAKKSTEESSPIALYGILGAIIAIVIALLLFLMTKKKPDVIPDETIIDEVFLMYNDGRLIKHFTRRLKPDMDEDILSSMLVAVQDFVKDSFRDQEGVLDEMNFGRFQVLLGRGEHLILATIVLGDDSEHLKVQVTQCIKDIEEKYADVLEEWDGDMQSLRGAAKYVMDLIDGNYAKEQ